MAHSKQKNQAACDGKLRQTSDLEPNYHKATKSFHEMNLRDELLRGIYKFGVQSPTVFQQRTMVPCIRGRNVIVQAYSGDCKGKAAAFALAILQKVNCEMKTFQAISLAPTYERVWINNSTVLTFGHAINAGFNGCMADATVEENVAKLPLGYQLTTGTPKNVHALVSLPAFRIVDVKLIVLDQVDEMLSRGYKDHIYNIFKALPPGVQVITSITSMSPDVAELMKNFMHDPVRIVIEKNSSGQRDMDFEGMLEMIGRTVGRQTKEEVMSMVKESVDADESKYHVKQ